MSFSSTYLGLTALGNLVQELEVAKIRPRRRALSCYAVQSGHAIRPGNHQGRCALDCDGVMLFFSSPLFSSLPFLPAFQALKTRPLQ